MLVTEKIFETGNVLHELLVYTTWLYIHPTIYCDSTACSMFERKFKYLSPVTQTGSFLPFIPLPLKAWPLIDELFPNCWFRECRLRLYFGSGIIRYGISIQMLIKLAARVPSDFVAQMENSVCYSFGRYLITYSSSCVSLIFPAVSSLSVSS